MQRPESVKSDRWIGLHRHGSSVNFGGKTFCPKICVRKINKMPEYYMIIARKIFFPNFREARAPRCPPVSYARGWYVQKQFKVVRICKASKFVVLNESAKRCWIIRQLKEKMKRHQVKKDKDAVTDLVKKAVDCHRPSQRR